MAFRRPPQMLDNDLPQATFEGLGWQSPTSGIGPACDQAVRDIVGKAFAMALGVGRGEEIAGLIPELARQDSGLGDGLTLPSRSCAGVDELRLDILPECFVDDRGVLPG